MGAGLGIANLNLFLCLAEGTRPCLFPTLRSECQVCVWVEGRGCRLEHGSLTQQSAVRRLL